MRTLSLNLMPRRQALLTLLEDDCEPAEWATKAGPLVEAPNETCFLERADRRLDGGATESTERSYHEEDGSMQLARIPGVTYGFSVPEIRGGELACLVKQLRFS